MVMPCSPLGRQPVDQEREVEVRSLSADLLRLDGQGFEVVLEDEVRLVEEPTDQGALAIVDAAAGDEAQQGLVLVGVQVRVDVVGDESLAGMGHQKYPSCFFFSIDPEESKSMTRPWRSEVVVRSISWMTAVRVVASLSTAPVSG